MCPAQERVQGQSVMLCLNPPHAPASPHPQGLKVFKEMFPNVPLMALTATGKDKWICRGASPQTKARELKWQC